MPSAGMFRSVDLVRTEGSEEHIASINRVTKIGELGTAENFNSDDGGDMFLRYVGSYRSHVM
jgi:hypothetical protein